jgi:hypothetical protein
MNTLSLRLPLRLIREVIAYEQTLVRSLPHAWRQWCWAQPWWPVGLWWNGRVWLWQQRLLAFSRVPLARGGWRTDPWQRRSSRILPELMFVVGLLLGLWIVLQLVCSESYVAPK